MLIGGIHTSDFFRYRFHGLLAGLTAVLAQAANQAFFSEFCPVAILGFSDTVGIEGQQVSGLELVFRDRAIQSLKRPSSVPVESRCWQVLSGRRTRAERCPQLA